MRRRLQEVQRAGQLDGCLLGVLTVSAVGLVDGQHVGQLQHALLDALQRVPTAGQQQHEERVDHLGDGDLRLTDPHRLHEHDVEARRFDHDDRLSRRPRHPAERARRRRRADVGVGILGQAGHARLVAEDAPAGPRRGRVDGEDGNAVTLAGQHRPDGVDERRLADSGHARDADALRGAGVRRQLDEHLLGQRPVVRLVSTPPA